MTDELMNRRLDYTRDYERCLRRVVEIARDTTRRPAPKTSALVATLLFLTNLARKSEALPGYIHANDAGEIELGNPVHKKAPPFKVTADGEVLRPVVREEKGE